MQAQYWDELDRLGQSMVVLNRLSTKRSDMAINTKRGGSGQNFLRSKPDAKNF